MIYSKTKYQLHYLVLNLLVIGACEIFLADVIFDVFNYDLIKLHWVSHTQVEVVFTLCLGITLFFLYTTFVVYCSAKEGRNVG